MLADFHSPAPIQIAAIKPSSETPKSDSDARTTVREGASFKQSMESASQKNNAANKSLTGERSTSQSNDNTGSNKTSTNKGAGVNSAPTTLKTDTDQTLNNTSIDQVLEQNKAALDGEILDLAGFVTVVEHEGELGNASLWAAGAETGIDENEAQSESQIFALVDAVVSTPLSLSASDDGDSFFSNLQGARAALTQTAIPASTLLATISQHETAGVFSTETFLGGKLLEGQGSIAAMNETLDADADLLTRSFLSLVTPEAKAEGETVSGALAANAVKGIEALAAAQRPNTASLAFNQPFSQAGWNNEVGEKVLWMAAQNLKFADIRLDPPELGSLQVRVTVQNEQAQVSFISPHPAVREALDSQATRLREMMADQGLTLVDVNVSDRESRQGDRSENPDDEGLQESEEVTLIAESAVSSVNLVDHYV